MIEKKVKEEKLRGESGKDCWNLLMICAHRGHLHSKSVQLYTTRQKSFLMVYNYQRFPCLV